MGRAKSIRGQDRAGVQFPLTRIDKYVRAHSSIKRTSPSSSIALAVTIGEVLRAWGDAAKAHLTDKEKAKERISIKAKHLVRTASRVVSVFFANKK